MGARSVKHDAQPGASPLLQRLPLDRFFLLVALAVVFAGFVAKSPSFGKARNIETIARQTAIVGTAALGMTIIIAAGGIDLSVGSVVALTTVVIAWMLQRGFGQFAAAAAGIAAGAACGLINGMLVTWLRLIPFIVTLGTLLIFRGMASGLAGEQKIDAPLPENDTRILSLGRLLATLDDQHKWLFVAPGVWMLLLLSVVVTVVLYYTRFGLHIFAVGSNEPTARLCGVRVARVKVMIYVMGGLLAGLAGLLQFSRLTVGDPTVAVGLELDVIAAVVIGGGSLAGGQGSVFGTILGALFLNVIRSGCAQNGLSNWHQQVVTGTIIILAVTLDRLRHRRTA